MAEDEDNEVNAPPLGQAGPFAQLAPNFMNPQLMQHMGQMMPRPMVWLRQDHYKKNNSRLETLDQLISVKFLQMRKFGNYKNLIN